MKRFLLATIGCAFMSASAMAAPLSFATTFAGGFVSLPSTVSDTSVSFQNFDATSSLCSIACTDVTFDTGTVLSNGAGEIFTFVGSGVTFTSNATPWTVVLGPNDSRVVTLLGTYAKGGDSNLGSLTFTYQGTGVNNLTTFSASGSTVPEPGSMALLGSGLIGLGWLGSRRRKL